ncbi:MAG: hypothetical protein ABWY00_08905, partial [Dongiaceae bacterium]
MNDMTPVANPAERQVSITGNAAKRIAWLMEQEGDAVDDAVAVALKDRAAGALGLGHQAAAGMLGIAGI